MSILFIKLQGTIKVVDIVKSQPTLTNKRSNMASIKIGKTRN